MLLQKLNRSISSTSLVIRHINQHPIHDCTRINSLIQIVYSRTTSSLDYMRVFAPSQTLLNDNSIPTEAEVEAAQNASIAVINKHASLREQLKRYSLAEGHGDDIEGALAAVFERWDST